MVWISNFFYCMGSAAVAGSIMTVILASLAQTARWKNSRITLVWLKISLILFCFPLGFVMVMLRRIDFGQSSLLLMGDFGFSTTMTITRSFTVLGCIWLAGLMVGIWKRIFQYTKLRYILQGNVPVDAEWENIIHLYHKKLKISKVKVSQNDLLGTPITVGIWKPQIVLPFARYTVKEMSMILEHELNHVCRRDLIWKRIGLFVTWLHWWNPLVYVLLDMLKLWQEIECDIRTCESTELFTMQEYGLFLARISTEREEELFSSALSGTKKNLMRRLEGMVNGRKAKKCKKITAMISCLVMCLASVTPAYAATEGVAQQHDKWLDAQEIEVEAEPVTHSMVVPITEVADDTEVTEIDLTGNGASVLASTVVLDYTIGAGVRVLYGYRNMEVGDKVTITAVCNDESITYRIGIKNGNTNTSTYVQGTGVLTYTFTIEEAGRYSAYVENRSSVAMDVKGSAVYPD